MNGFDRIRAAYDAQGLDEHERAVLVLLAFMANDDAQAWPSIAYIVEKTGKGERTVQRAIQRLAAAGHVHRKQLRHGVIYTVEPAAEGSRPVPQTGVSGTPDSETPVPQTARPVPQTPKLPRTTNTSEPKGSSVKRARPKREFVLNERPPGLPKSVSSNQWSGFVSMRARIRKPLTPRAVELAIEKLAAFEADGQQPGDILDQSVLNGWAGLFPLRDDSGGELLNPMVRAAAARRARRDDSGWLDA